MPEAVLYSVRCLIGSRRSVLFSVALMLAGCTVSAGGAFASKEMDSRARETLRALAASDTAALDTLVLERTRTSDSFKRVAELARMHFAATVATRARLIGSEVSTSPGDSTRYRVSYAFEADSSSITADIWFVTAKGTPLIETIAVVGRRRD